MTKEIKRLGWYRELRHGLPDSVSVAQTSNLSRAERDLLSNYLTAGSIVAAAGVDVIDVIDGSTVIDRELRTLTDGTFVWPSDLPYYVSKYGSPIPTEFLEHVHSMTAFPVVTDDQIFEIVESMML